MNIDDLWYRFALSFLFKSIAFLINLIMAIYEILIVGAAFSRDYAMIVRKRLFLAAESRSYEEFV